MKTRFNQMHSRIRGTLVSVYLLTCLASLFHACDDPPPAITKADQELVPELDMESTQVDASVELDQELEDMMPEKLDLGFNEIAWIELKLSPIRSVYNSSDIIRLSIEAYDVYGDIDSNHALEVSYETPLGSFNIIDSEQEVDRLTTERELDLHFTQEGSSVIKVCSVASDVDSEIVCARRPILVDDSSPEIEVFWPPRGAMLASTDVWPIWENLMLDSPEPLPSYHGLLETPDSNLTRYIPVYGQVSGLGSGRLTLNDREIEVSEDGYFSTIIPQRSGFVELNLVADDEIRINPSRNRRWVLFAADYIEHQDHISPIPLGIDLAVHQSFVDQDKAPVSNMPYQVTEIAQLIDLFLSLIDTSRLLIQSNLITSPEISLSVENIDLASPDIDLQITDDGLALFCNLNRVSIEVEGQLNVGSSPIDLSGQLILSLSAYADYQLSTGQETLTVDYLGGGVAVTQITPQLNEPAANAIISVLDSRARTIIVEQLETQLNLLFRRDIPILLEVTVDDIYRTIDEIPLELNSGFENSQTADLLIEITPRAVSANVQEQVLLRADVNIQNRSETIAHDESRGTPRLTLDPDRLIDNSPVSFTIQPEFVNALLVEIWRSQLLDLSPPLPASASLFFSEVQASALCPPILTIGESFEPYPLYLELGGLQLNMTQSASNLDDTYEIFIRVGASLQVDGGMFTIQLEDQPQVEVTLSSLGNERPAVTEQLISNLFTEQIWPELSTALISRLVLGIPDSQFSLSELAYLGIDLDEAWVRPNFDQRIYYAPNGIVLGGELLFDFP